MKNPETLDFTRNFGAETRGIRTPDNLIKRQIKTPYFRGFAPSMSHLVSQGEN